MYNRGADSLRRLLTVPKISVENGGEPVDKYTAGIELSNACRQFYVTRVKAAGQLKERLGLWDTGVKSENDACCTISDDTEGTNDLDDDTKDKFVSTNAGNSRIERAMNTLKYEMASLIDQDLALMKQLLTLNEQIEELKWQRKLRGYQVEGSGASSCNIDSNVSVSTISDGEWESRLLDQRELPGKYPTPSSLSLYSDYGTSPRASMDRELGRPVSGIGGGPGPSKLLQDNTHKLVRRESTSDLGSSDELTSSNSELPDNNSGGQTMNSGEQQSFDSGIHEPHRDKNMQRLNVKTYELTL